MVESSVEVSHIFTASRESARIRPHRRKGQAASHWFCAVAYLDECIHNLSLYYFQRRMGGQTVA
jgi:hypothetical protein